MPLWSETQFLPVGSGFQAAEITRLVELRWPGGGIEDGAAVSLKVTVCPVSKTRVTLMRGFLTSTTCMLSKHRCPSSVTILSIFSLCLGMELSFAATYPTILAH